MSEDPAQERRTSFVPRWLAALVLGALLASGAMVTCQVLAHGPESGSTGRAPSAKAR